MRTPSGGRNLAPEWFGGLRSWRWNRRRLVVPFPDSLDGGSFPGSILQQYFQEALRVADRDVCPNRACAKLVWLGSRGLSSETHPL